MPACKKCTQEKAQDEFYRTSKNKSRYMSICKDCLRLRNREKYNKMSKEERIKSHLDKYSKIDKNAARLRSLRHYTSIEGRAKTLIKGVRDRQPDHSLTLEWFISKLKIGRCEVTGLQFDFNPHQLYKKNPLSPSIDRICSDNGYFPENCRLVIWQYNMAKGETNDVEFIAFCESVIAAKERILNAKKEILDS